MTLTFLLYLWCPAPILVDRSGLGWTPRDKEIVSANSRYCEKKMPKVPCVVKFIKKSTLNYHIICGKKRGKGE